MIDPAERPDKVTVGVTKSGSENLKKLMETGWFAKEIDAYRIAVTTALSRGQVAEPEEMAGATTKFNVGSMDPEGQMRRLISTLAPDLAQRPYDAAERLAEAGLALLASKLSVEGVLLSDILDPSEPAGD